MRSRPPEPLLRPWALLLHFLLLGLADGTGPTPLLARRQRPQLHVATFANALAPNFSPLLASAGLHAGGIVVVGHGVPATWGKGLQAKIDVYRNFVLALPEAQDSDVVLLPDAYDTLLLQPQASILRAFETLEKEKKRSIFFGAETACVVKCDELDALAAKEGASSPWKYLNSGLMAGRASALKRLFRDPANLSACAFCIGDQEWFVDYLLKHPEEAALDYSCRLFQNVFGVHGLLDGPWSADFKQPAGSLVLRNGSLANARFGTVPAVAHFPGPGKWPRRLPCSSDASRECESSVLLEAFRAFFPREYAGSGLLAAQLASDDLRLPDALRLVRGYQVMDNVEVLIQKLANRDLLILCLALAVAALLAGLAGLPQRLLARLGWRGLQRPARVVPE